MGSDAEDQPQTTCQIASQPLQDLQNRLGYFFTDDQLLCQALTHRSTPQDFDLKQDTKPPVWHNERLEFLGDAVLDLVVSALLYERYPDAPEGALSHWRSSLVNTRSLSILAREIGLGDCLIMGRGEDLSGGRKKISILGDCFEAILGAIYLDGGLVAVQTLLSRLMGEKVEKLRDANKHKDYKSLLQESLQSNGRPLPAYQVASIEGPPHERTFEVNCRLEDDGTLGIGVGNSKRHAEQSAARQVFEKLIHLDKERNSP
ncbi:MAG: ribonuclease III [Magnetococcales bacterium]|nr:ribonuclease III [Magnetococcales bacterium]